MVVTASRRRTRRFDGAEAAAFPTFDLLSEQRRRETVLARLDAARRAFIDALSGPFQVMFNDGGVRMGLGPWRECQGVADLWLAASVPAQPGASVYFGLNGPTLFMLSELFFGGTGMLAEQDFHQRSVTETEERLARKLFLYQLNALTGALGLAPATWDIRWAAEGPPPMPVGEVTFTRGQFQASWQLCWPPALDGAEPEPASPPAELEVALRDALTRVPVRLRVEVGELRTALGRIGQLRAGDVLPLELHEQAVARLGSVVCCRGRVAEQGGSLVLQVTAVPAAGTQTTLGLTDG